MTYQETHKIIRDALDAFAVSELSRQTKRYIVGSADETLYAAATDVIQSLHAMCDGLVDVAVQRAIDSHISEMES